MSQPLYYFIYIILSGGFIVTLFLLAIILDFKTDTPRYVTRKLIHILFANYYFIPFMMVPHKEDVLIAIIPPLIFAGLNFLSYRYKIVKAIERDDQKEIGTIIYPLSLALLLVVANYFFEIPYIGLLGALLLGYGDGIAGIIGRKYNKQQGNKSLIGFLSMFVTSLIVALIVVFIFNGLPYLYFAPIIALLAALFEYYGPYGLDNFTVPLFSAIAYYLLILVAL